MSATSRRTWLPNSAPVIPTPSAVIPKLSRLARNGYLGIDWELNNNLYRIKRIVTPAVWDTEVRSPFDKPGVDVKPGDYILAVNGWTWIPGKIPTRPLKGFLEKPPP